jgi:hypothetical protein
VEEVQRPEDAYDSARVASANKRPTGEDGPILLVGATAWHWTTQGEHDSIDVLFVDEAGQMSLADAIAVSQAARSVVLLGDPQQLAHVSQGTHPLASGATVLEHLLGDRDTVPPTAASFSTPHGHWTCTPTSATSSRAPCTTRA